MSTGKKILSIKGKALVHRGRDIDTDRIIPARFMKLLTFDHLGKHVFNDERRQMNKAGQTHPFDDADKQDATVLITGPNFGCGSSREHAPQALYRWGVRVIIGSSFGEIFAGNCVSVGLPFFTVSEEVVQEITDLVDANPDIELVADLETKKIEIPAMDKSYDADIPEGNRKQFIAGQWDQTTLLYQAHEDVVQKSGDLPYISDFPYDAAQET